jgi:hypothetical protein
MALAKGAVSAKMAAHQPYNQQHDEDKPQSATDAITTAPAVIAAAVISKATPEQEDHQHDDQDQFHHRFSSSAALTAPAVDGKAQEFQEKPRQPAGSDAGRCHFELA